MRHQRFSACLVLRFNRIFSEIDGVLERRLSVFCNFAGAICVDVPAVALPSRGVDVVTDDFGFEDVDTREETEEFEGESNGVNGERVESRSDTRLSMSATGPEGLGVAEE